MKVCRPTSFRRDSFLSRLIATACVTCDEQGIQSQATTTRNGHPVCDLHGEVQ